mmetsp:Transcript_14205/g.16165  ORF Transcript_14205/g.16165 Transcript_14205/m.16165 type:complete len:336 (+) Transcript_14205:231-1238(+)
MSTCIELWPASTCGVHGTCVNNQCVCEDGWSVNLELDFNLRGSQTEWCNYNRKLISFLYSVLVFTSLLSILMLFYVRRPDRTDNRLFFVGSIGFIISGILRICRPNQALLGKDPTFTFIITLAAALNLWAAVCFLKDFLKYLRNSANVNDRRRIGDLASKLLKIGPVIGFIQLIGWELFWISSLIDEDSKQTKFFLWKFGLCLFIVVVIYLLFSLLLTFAFVDDMQKLLSNVSVRSHDNPFLVALRSKIPQTKRMRNTFLFIYTFLLLLLLLTLVSSIIFQQLSYFIPISFIFGTVCGYPMIFNTMKSGMLSNGSNTSRRFGSFESANTVLSQPF